MGNHSNPPRFHRKGRMWYHVTGTQPRIWTRLSIDRAEALVLWAQQDAIQSTEHPHSFMAIVKRYIREVLPHKALRTRQGNEEELRQLLPVFGKMPIGDIQPLHIRQYLDTRGLVAKVRANREKALFSHIFNKAREWGYTNATNPCQGVKGFRETGRDRYVSDEEFQQVQNKAHPTVADAMTLALLTGQRPGDLLKMRWADVYQGALHVQQGKTGVKLAIAIIGHLAAALDAIETRHGAHRGPWILQEANGQPLSYRNLRARFTKAKKAAGVEFQFRDIRAKAATDTGDLAHSQQLLGHTKRDMTEHYVRSRQGAKVMPLR